MFLDPGMQGPDMLDAGMLLEPDICLDLDLDEAQYPTHGTETQRWHRELR